MPCVGKEKQGTCRSQCFVQRRERKENSGSSQIPLFHYKDLVNLYFSYVIASPNGMLFLNMTKALSLISLPEQAKQRSRFGSGSSILFNDKGKRAILSILIPQQPSLRFPRQGGEQKQVERWDSHTAHLLFPSIYELFVLFYPSPPQMPSVFLQFSWVHTLIYLFSRHTNGLPRLSG